MNLKDTKKALLLGGLGFIGRTLAKRLHNSGQKVIIYDQNTERIEGITSVIGTLSNLDSLAELLHAGDDVFHFAYSGVPSSVDGQEQIVEQNLKELCQLCIAKECRLIFPSSGGTVYGEAEFLPISENHKLKPISSYGMSKLRQEKIIKQFGDQGLRYIIFRIANCYGPGVNLKKPQGIIGIALHNIINKLPIEILGDGRQVRDFIYIDDVIDGFYTAFQKDITDLTLNIGTGVGTSIINVIEKIETVVNQKAEIRSKQSRDIDVEVNILDVRLAKTTIDWKAEVSIDEGIYKTYQAFSKS